MKIENIPISKLTAYEGNPKKHPPEQIDKLKASIAEFGWTNPVLVDKDNVVIAGHGRIEAAMQSGITEAPVIRLEHLTPAQAKAYRIADNRLTETGSWDRFLLSSELDDLADLNFDIDLTGFDLGDMGDAITGDWPDLPTGGGELGNMTFIVSSGQRDVIEGALRDAKKAGLGSPRDGNENSNGNALAEICKAWAQNN